MCSCPKTTPWALLSPCTWGFKLAEEIKCVQVEKPTKAAERTTGNKRRKNSRLCQALENLWVPADVGEVLRSRQ